MERKPFSYAEGVAVQQQDLERWKRVLTPKAFERLRQYCVTTNANKDQNDPMADTLLPRLFSHRIHHSPVL